VLLIVVAVFNPNVVPVVAANGAVTIGLWLIALAVFFLPQGIAVIEFSRRYPSEGGIYVWTKELFGDFHGFLCGWCYWTDNIFYLPTVLIYMVSICVYVGGEWTLGLADNRTFALMVPLSLLWLLVVLNVRGLGVGKWVNNLGGMGSAIGVVALIALAVSMVRAHGSALASGRFTLHNFDWRLLSTFGVICFGLVGLELGSIMSDEIHDPRRTVPSAVLWGGISCGVLFLSASLSILTAIPHQEIRVTQGIIQAISRMAVTNRIPWIVRPLALILAVSIAGTASAWFAGSARIPFVAGLDRYLPAALGKVHPKYLTPHVALLVQATLSSVFLIMSFAGTTVKEAYLTLLDLAVVLQLVPFLYMYAGLVRLAAHSEPDGYSERKLRSFGLCGFVATFFGMALAFVPARSIESIGLFEVKMCVGVILFVVIASAFFWTSARRRL